MSLRTAGIAALWALLVLQFAWYGWLAPPQVLPAALPLLLLAGPLLLPAIGLVCRRPDSLFWGAVISLLHFSVGVMELWSDPDVRLLAALQVALALLLIGAVAADGLKRRRAARDGAPPQAR